MRRSELTEYELDTLVAEHVMGWRWYRGMMKDGFHRALCMPEQNPGSWELADGTEPIGGHFRGQYAVPEYSTKWGAAGQVVEKLRGDGWGVTITTQEPLSHNFGVSFCKGEGLLDPHGEAASESAPEAICLAALRAVGVDLEGIVAHFDRREG